MFHFQLFIDPAKLLPLQRFLPKPPGSIEKRGRGGGGRGGRGSGRGISRGGGGNRGGGGFGGRGSRGNNYYFICIYRNNTHK